jgi:predicted DNA-binding protein
MSHRLQVMVSEELEARLKKAASRGRVSKGEWVRQAIERRLEHEACRMPEDPLEALGCLDGPTADIDEMLEQIEGGRG